MTRSGPAGVPDPGIAEFVAQRTAEYKEAARAVRDEAAAAGTLVWDPYDPAWVDDPYAVYAELRRSNPVHRNALGFWVFTRHADCLAILRDRRSSSDGRNVDTTSFREVRAVDLPLQPGPEAMLAEMAPFLFRDPPDHTRLRGLVQKAFTPRVVEGLRPRLEEICDGLLDEAFERGEIDLVADYAYPLPVQIIVEMLGVPSEDHEQFRVWSHVLARGLDPDFLLPPEAVQQRLGAILSFVQYFASLIEERRQRPGEDLLTRLIQAEEQGDMLTQGELLSTCILLLVAGHETTVNLIVGRGARPAGATRPTGAFARRSCRHPQRRRGDAALRVPCPVDRTRRARRHGGRWGSHRGGGVLDVAHRVGQPRSRRLRRCRHLRRGASRQQPSGLRIRDPSLPGRPARPARGADRVAGPAAPGPPSRAHERRARLQGEHRAPRSREPPCPPVSP